MNPFLLPLVYYAFVAQPVADRFHNTDAVECVNDIYWRVARVGTFPRAGQSRKALRGPRQESCRV